MPTTDSKAGLLEDIDEIFRLIDVGSCLVMDGTWFERLSIYNGFLPGLPYGKSRL